ncbi:MAG TPA: hypothetical protein VG186_07295 [Solirubrobacteraceae bacterium]|jgi:hypothetical protein|nr:hypothetical protein [Solirubrobacteraceae bacterium]
MFKGTALLRRTLTFVLLLLLGSACLADAASAGTYAVLSCSGNDAPVFQSPIPTGFGLGVNDECATLGPLALVATSFPATNGSGEFLQAAAQWNAVTPSSALSIVFINADGSADCNLATDGWSASYFWGDNGTNYGTSPVSIDCHGGPEGNGEAGYVNQAIEPSRYFGFYANCNGACAAAGAANLVFGVRTVTLVVEEDTGPSLQPSEANDLYNQAGWVRGTFQAGSIATDPSGVCTMQTVANGVVVASYRDAAPDASNWAQCPDSPLSPPNIDTTGYHDGSGAISLAYSASNAAGVGAQLSRSINVDNAAVNVALSGPSEAPATAGTQYITATATAGLSGVQGISCSLDGGPAQWYAGSTERVPVSGLGNHTLTCRAENNSYNSSGQALWSAPATTFKMDIGDPTVSGISFSKIIHGLKCKRAKERVRVPARWVLARRHGKLVRVRRRAHSKVVRVVKCHPRIVKRTVTVLVKKKRHGRTVLVRHKKVEKVVLPPKIVGRASKRVAFGKAASISGFLGTSDGVALAGHTVEVLTTPDDGLGQWTPAAAVTTAANGVWTATLPPGPSRLVEAAYAGDSTTLASSSASIHLVVPARVKIHVSRRRTPWGGQILISGRVLGGYIPAGKLLRLRIGVAGVRGTVGIPSVRPNGRFSTTWTFAAGRGAVRYWFSVSTLNEADYPYAPASSRRVYVTVGPG